MPQTLWNPSECGRLRTPPRAGNIVILRSSRGSALEIGRVPYSTSANNRPNSRDIIEDPIHANPAEQLTAVWKHHAA